MKNNDKRLSALLDQKMKTDQINGFEMLLEASFTDPIKYLLCGEDSYFYYQND